MQQVWSTAKLSTLFMTGLLILALPMLAHACAVCVGSDDHGYFWGVLFLMSMPFAVGCCIGGWVLYSYRRRQAGVDPSASTTTVDRRMPWSVSTPSVSARHDDGSQVHHA